MRLNTSEYVDTRFDEAAFVDEGYLYEPRVWWEVSRFNSGAVPVSGNLNPAGRVTLSGENFYNSSRHTIVFTHISVCAVNYIMEELVTTPVDPESFDNDSSIIQKMNWLLSAPFRAHISKNDVVNAAIIAEPAGEPTMRYAQAPFASGLLGLSRWTFERPLWIPRNGVVKLDISSAPTTGADVALTTPEIQSAVLFDEGYPDGGRFRRHQRFRERADLGYAAPAASLAADATFPGGAQPFQVDAFESVGKAGTQGMWSPSGLFTSHEWKRQAGTRGDSKSWLTGFGVHLDQIDHDQHLQTSALAGVAGNPITPFSQRLGCRARTTNGGTNEWWWRPGAPLALVCPTITPAQVHKLREPIVAAKGDSFEIELQFPGAASVFSPPIAPIYQVGFSMIGYAVVEG